MNRNQNDRHFYRQHCPSKSHLKLRHREDPFNYKYMFQLSHRFAILHRARWYDWRALFKVNDSIIELDVIDSRVFAKFEIQINFGWMTYVNSRQTAECLH